ncbi:MAG: prepilin-type N-terminal cleavage/methylation domain-containing protein [Solirubrobacterales bacterium]
MRKQKGFTLVEMMIVIAIIAILAAVLIPKAGQIQQNAKSQGADANLRVTQGLLEQYRPRMATLGELRTVLRQQLVASALTNPINKSVYMNDDVANAGPGIATSVFISRTAPSATTTGDNWKGIVYVFFDSANDNIVLRSYDANGVIMTTTTID